MNKLANVHRLDKCLLHAMIHTQYFIFHADANKIPSKSISKLSRVHGLDQALWDARLRCYISTVAATPYLQNTSTNPVKTHILTSDNALVLEAAAATTHAMLTKIAALWG